MILNWSVKVEIYQINYEVYKGIKQANTVFTF